MQLTFLSEEPPARASASRVLERDWMIRVATSCSSMVQLLADIGPVGWSGRTSAASFQTTMDADLEAFWDCLAGNELKSHLEDGSLRALSQASKALTASHGACLTHNIAEWTGLDGLSLNDDGVSSLSDILETGDVPQRYYLSAKACKGILRRAAKRGKQLPTMLHLALQTVAGALSAPARREAKTPLSRLLTH